MEALEMEKPMTEWNEDRLDELNGRVKDGFAKVDERFDKVDERFVRLEGEMKQGFARVDREMKEGLGDVRGEIQRLNERFDRLFHALMVIAWGFAGTLLAALAGLVVVLI